MLKRLCPGKVPTRFTVEAFLPGLAVFILLFAGCSILRKLERGATSPTPFVTGSPDSTGLVVVDCDAYYDPSVSVNLFSLREIVSNAIDDLLSPDGELMDLKGGKLTGADETIISGEISRENSHPVLVFSNLAPGTYRLTEFTVSHIASTEMVDKYYDCERPTEDQKFVFFDECPTRFDFTYVLDAQTHNSLTVEVQPGRVHYLGKFHLIETKDPPYGNVRTVDEIRKGYLGYYKGSVRIDSKRYSDKQVARIAPDAAIEIEALSKVLNTLQGKSAGTSDDSWCPIIRARIATLFSGLREPRGE